MRYIYLFMIAGMFWALPAPAQQTVDSIKADSALVSYSIRGMSCPACGLSVDYSLKTLKGILHYKVDFREGNARISYDPRIIQKEKIEKALKSTGYTITEKKPEKAEKKDES